MSTDGPAPDSGLEDLSDDIRQLLDERQKRAEAGSGYHPEPATEEEAAEMMETFEWIAHVASNDHKTIHMVGNTTDEVLCRDRFNRHTEVDFLRSPAESFPLDHGKVCDYCTDAWREGVGV